MASTVGQGYSMQASSSDDSIHCSQEQHGDTLGRWAMLADPAWNAQETIITRAMLARAESIVVCNALRGVLPAHLIAGA